MNAVGNGDSRPDPKQSLVGIEEYTGSALGINSAFMDMARLRPEAPAICSGELTISYAQLRSMSCNLSRKIAEMQSGTGGVVGIYGTRSAELVVAVLASIHSGCTFAILDAAYPADRLQKQVAVIGADLIIGVQAGLTELEAVFSTVPNVPRLALGSLDLHRPVDADAVPAQPPSPIAYLLFTSGTTGMPKCIKTGHAPLQHFVEFYAQAFQPAAGERFSMLSGVGHDPFLRDVFVPLGTGGQIHIPQEADIRNPGRLFAWLAAHGIGFVHATPQLLKLMCAGQGSAEPLQDLKYFFSGGDVLLSAHVSALARAAPRAKVVNFYGASETPQAMGFHVVESVDLDGRIPLGRGIRDVQLLVLNEDMTLANVGVNGQIAIRTHFLSDGYLGDLGNTRHNFIQSPFTGDPQDLIYLSGDQGYFREDGSVVGIGRLDDQVKVRGYRVELSDVSQALDRTGLLANAVVLAQEANNGETMLVAYVVDKQGARAPAVDAVRTDALRQAAEALLPAYMVPAQFIWMAEIPLSPNGKVDRAKLLARQRSADSEVPDLAEAQGPAAALASQWREILSLPRLDVSRSFVQLGGDSLSYIQASLAVENHLGWLPDDWEKLPLSALAKMPRKGAATHHQMGTPVVVRALSIVLIVLGVFEVFDIVGPTYSLFVVAGWSFGKYQLRAILERQSVRPLFASIYQIALPTIAFTVLQAIKSKTLFGPGLFLVSNFYSPIEGNGLAYWFIEVLIQMFLLLALMFSVPAVRAFTARNAYRAGMVFWSVSLVIGLLSERVWDMNYLYQRVPQHHFWMLFLGMAIAYAETTRQRLVLSAILVALTLLGIEVPYACFAVLAIIWIPKVAVPRTLLPLINYLAVASMYIYLSRYIFKNALGHTPLAAYPAVGACVALLGGLLVWKVWERGHAVCANWLSSHLGRARQR